MLAAVLLHLDLLAVAVVVVVLVFATFWLFLAVFLSFYCIFDVGVSSSLSYLRIKPLHVQRYDYYQYQ